jgi:hypothetical protein
MGASGREFLEVREKLIVAVDKAYYLEHYEVFKPPNTVIKSAYVEGENHEGDLQHAVLLKAYYKAQKELRDYEYNKRYGNPNHKT